MTIYNDYNTEARNMILFFLDKYFKDRERLVTPIDPLVTNIDYERLEKLFNKPNYKEDYKILNTEVRKYGINIPPLVSAYMNLSPSMRVFGTVVYHEFGAVEDTGILIDFNDIFKEKKKRHVESFLKEQPTKAFLRRLRRMIAGKKECPVGTKSNSKR